MAQVYSVNAVGYVNLVIPAGFSINANPLNSQTNTVPNLFASAPTGTSVYKLVNGTYAQTSLGRGGWSDVTMTLVPGQGFFVNAPSQFTNTFVGEVMQGSLTNSFPAGFSLLGSQVPQAGGLQTALGYNPVAGDTVYTFNGTTYNTITFGRAGWTPAEPSISVGQGFFLNSAAGGLWTRTFTTQQ